MILSLALSPQHAQAPSHQVSGLEVMKGITQMMFVSQRGMAIWMALLYLGTDLVPLITRF